LVKPFPAFLFPERVNIIAIQLLEVIERVFHLPDNGKVGLRLSIGPDVPPERHTGREGARVPATLPADDAAVGAGVVGDVRAAAVVGAVLVFAVKLEWGTSG